jgi:tetratricopeptide (TPR) repeat protein
MSGYGTTTFRLLCATVLVLASESVLATEKRETTKERSRDSAAAEKEAQSLYLKAMQLKREKKFSEAKAILEKLTVEFQTTSLAIRASDALDEVLKLEKEAGKLADAEKLPKELGVYALKKSGELVKFEVLANGGWRQYAENTRLANWYAPPSKAARVAWDDVDYLIVFEHDAGSATLFLDRALIDMSSRAWPSEVGWGDGLARRVIKDGMIAISKPGQDCQSVRSVSASETLKRLSVEFGPGPGGETSRLADLLILTIRYESAGIIANRKTDAKVWGVWLECSANEQPALFAIRASCNAGVAKDCVSIGDIYKKGEGVVKDQAQVMMYYTKACDGGVAAGCYNLACLAALSGRTDQALALLGRAVDAGYQDFDRAKKDEDLVSLKGRPEFHALFRRMGGDPSLLGGTDGTDSKPPVSATGKGAPFNEKGLGLATAGNYAEAVEYFRKAIAAEPEYALAYYNLGYSLRRLARYAEAVVAYKTFALLQPKDPVGFCDLGEAHNGAGEKSEALAAYQRCLDLASEQGNRKYIGKAQDMVRQLKR